MQRSVVCCHYFGEPLDVFVEKPARDETSQSEETTEQLLHRISLNIKDWNLYNQIQGGLSRKTLL